jgi:acyl dehydratase
MTEPCVRALEILRGRLNGPASCGAWHTIDQAQIDRFADATGDRQYIHVDPRRAAVESPYKTTIAHGFLTLALVPRLAESLPKGDPDALAGVAVAINYGLNRVRFPAPVKVGSRVRLRRRPLSVEPRGPHVLLLAHEDTVEVEGQDRPGCVAETLVVLRYACAGAS